MAIKCDSESLQIDERSTKNNNLERTMAIIDKLNIAWETNVEQDLLFEFRALVDSSGGFYAQLVQALDEIERLQGESSFANLDDELKQEAIAIRNHLRDLKTALDEHLDFINWSQPK